MIEPVDVIKLDICKYCTETRNRSGRRPVAKRVDYDGESLIGEH